MSEAMLLVSESESGPITTGCFSEAAVDGLTS